MGLHFNLLPLSCPLHYPCVFSHICQSSLLFFILSFPLFLFFVFILCLIFLQYFFLFISGGLSCLNSLCLWRDRSRGTHNNQLYYITFVTVLYKNQLYYITFVDKFTQLCQDTCLYKSAKSYLRFIYYKWED